MKSPLRSRYNKIKERCYSPNCKSYHRYGGRGIKMCDEWLNDFSAFETWCLQNGYAPNLMIDRIDNDGDYSPTNCRFATNKENCQHKGNTRFYTYNGKTQNLMQWCTELNLPYGTILNRLSRNGWTFERAITTPIRKRDKTSLIGKRFGRLTVISFAGIDGRNSKWLCKCDCGNEIVLKDHKLITGHTRSCGCLQKEVCYNAPKISGSDTSDEEGQKNEP